MDVAFILIALAVIVMVFLLFVGTYADMAKRSGITLSSRRDLLVQPFAYAVSILAVLLPALYFALSPLLHTFTSTTIDLVIPVALAIFGALILVGSLPLWFMHRGKLGFDKCLLLSARLMLVPVVDAFWASVAVFVSVVFATSALMISSLITTYLVVHSGDWLSSLIAALLVPSFSAPFALVFLAVGLLFAFYLHRLGPSEILAKYFMIMSYVALLVSLVMAAYLFMRFGGAAFLYSFMLAVIGFVAYIIYQATSWLYHTLRVAGVFGLELTIFSFFLLLVAYQSRSLFRELPMIGEIAYSLVPSFVWMIAFQVGIVGVILGITMIFVARKQSEKDQIMTRAMAISIGSSAFLPLISLVTPISLLGILGSGMSVLLVFVCAGPVYFVSVSVLRIVEAIKGLTQPRVHVCSNCGYANRAQAVFCGKCGTRL